MPPQRKKQGYLLGLLVLFLVGAWIPVITTAGDLELENIDSFDVHYSTRWDINSHLAFTRTIEDSILNISDVGDNSIDSFDV